jgi:hypothetical protein
MSRAALPSLVLCLSWPLLTACDPDAGMWELDTATPFIASDGFTLVVNRMQVDESPQGGGESTTVTTGRVDLWRFDGEPARTITSVDGISDKSGAGQLDELVWRAGHLWAASRDGVRRDGVVVGALTLEPLSTAIGAGPDGGVAVAFYDATAAALRVWSEGDANATQLRTVPELSQPWTRSSTPRGLLALSNGPRFGVAMWRTDDGADPVAAVAWAEGGQATTLAPGIPLAFWAGPNGTKTLLRQPVGTEYYRTDDVLFDETGPHALGSNEFLGTGTDGLPLWTCNAATFDPSGNALFLKGHRSGFTLQVGARSLEVPSGGEGVRECAVVSDGTTIHVVWTEKSRPNGIPRPRRLHHVSFVNEVLQDTHVVDVTPDRFAP